MHYFIRKRTDVSGPVEGKALKQLAADGGLAPDVAIREDGKVWVTARNVRGLFGAGESSSMPPTNAADDRPFDLFISYSHHNELEADAICGKLEAMGVRCWRRTSTGSQPSSGASWRIPIGSL